MGLNMIELARTILETHYALGETLEISELLGGTVNRTYAVSVLKDGIKQKLALFLEAYYRQCRVWPKIEPLNQQEKEYLPAMLMAANLFVLQWTINDYYAVTEPDNDAYGYYFEHGFSIMNWIPQQVDLIGRIVAQAG